MWVYGCMVPCKKIASYWQFEQIIPKSTQTQLSWGLQIYSSKFAYMVTSSFTSRHEQYYYTKKNIRIDDTAGYRFIYWLSLYLQMFFPHDLELQSF